MGVLGKQAGVWKSYSACRWAGLVGETDEVLMLAPNLGDIESGGSAQASGFIRIPKCAVTRRIKLVEDV